MVSGAIETRQATQVGLPEVVERVARWVRRTRQRLFGQRPARRVATA